MHNIALQIGDGVLKPDTPAYAAARKTQADYYDRIRDNFTKIAREIKPLTQKDFDDEVEVVTQNLASTLPILERSIRRSIEIKKELADKGYVEVDSRGTLYIVGERNIGGSVEGMYRLDNRGGDGLLYKQLLDLENDIERLSDQTFKQMERLKGLFNMRAIDLCIGMATRSKP